MDKIKNKKVGLIACGLVLLWLSPLVWGIASSAYKKHQKAEYDRNAEAWRKKMIDVFTPRISEAERAEYLKWREQDELRKRMEVAELLERVKPKPSKAYIPEERSRRMTYVERIYMQNLMQEILAPAPPRQPDLTGFYTVIPLTGPETGTVQINSVIGPR